MKNIAEAIVKNIIENTLQKKDPVFNQTLEHYAQDPTCNILRWLQSFKFSFNGSTYDISYNEINENSEFGKIKSSALNQDDIGCFIHDFLITGNYYNLLNPNNFLDFPQDVENQIQEINGGFNKQNIITINYINTKKLLVDTTRNEVINNLKNYPDIYKISNVIKAMDLHKNKGTNDQYLENEAIYNLSQNHKDIFYASIFFKIYAIAINKAYKEGYFDTTSKKEQIGKHLTLVRTILNFLTPFSASVFNNFDGINLSKNLQNIINNTEKYLNTIKSEPEKTINGKTFQNSKILELLEDILIQYDNVYKKTSLIINGSVFSTNSSAVINLINNGLNIILEAISPHHYSLDQKLQKITKNLNEQPGNQLIEKYYLPDKPKLKTESEKNSEINVKLSTLNSAMGSNLNFNFSNLYKQQSVTVNINFFKIIYIINYCYKRMKGKTTKIELKDDGNNIKINGVIFPKLVQDINVDGNDIAGNASIKFGSSSNLYINNKKIVIKNSNVVDTLNFSPLSGLVDSNNVVNLATKPNSYLSLKHLPSSGAITSELNLIFGKSYDSIKLAFINAFNNSNQIPQNVLNILSEITGNENNFWRPKDFLNSVNSVINTLIYSNNNLSQSEQQNEGDNQIKTLSNSISYIPDNVKPNQCLTITGINTEKNINSSMPSISLILNNSFSTTESPEILIANNKFDELINVNRSFFNERNNIDNNSSSNEEFQSKMKVFLKNILDSINVVKQKTNESNVYSKILLTNTVKNKNISPNIISKQTFFNELLKLIYLDAGLNDSFYYSRGNGSNNPYVLNRKDLSFQFVGDSSIDTYISRSSENILSFGHGIGFRKPTNYYKKFVPGFNFSSLPGLEQKTTPKANGVNGESPNPITYQTPIFTAGNEEKEDKNNQFIIQKIIGVIRGFLTNPGGFNGAIYLKESENQNIISSYADFLIVGPFQSILNNFIKNYNNSSPDKNFLTNFIYLEDYNTLKERITRIENKLQFILDFLRYCNGLPQSSPIQVGYGGRSATKPVTQSLINESSPDMFYEEPETDTLLLTDEIGTSYYDKNKNNNIPDTVVVLDNDRIPLSDIYGYNCVGTLLNSMGFKIYPTINNLNNYCKLDQTSKLNKWKTIVTDEYFGILTNDTIINQETQLENKKPIENSKTEKTKNKDDKVLQKDTIQKITKLNKYSQPFAALTIDANIDLYKTGAKTSKNFDYIETGYPIESSNDYLEEEEINFFYPENLLNSLEFNARFSNLILPTSPSISKMMMDEKNSSYPNLHNFIKILLYKLNLLGNKFIDINRASEYASINKSSKNMVRNNYVFQSIASKNVNMLNKKIPTDTIKKLIKDMF